LGLQGEIASRIADAIDVRLGQRSNIAGGRPRHGDSRAYEAYLKGRFFWNKRTGHDIQRAIQFFQEAIEIEPDYALAYSGLADAYHMLGSSYVASSMSPRDAFPKAHAAALKALEIDDSLAEAHASLAAVLGGYQWDWAGWARECRKAIELNENCSTAHQWYAESLAAVGQHDEALAAIRRAQQVDPLSAAVNATAAWILYFARRYELAEQQCRKTLETHPDFAPAHLYLGFVLEQTGRFDEALRQFRLAAEFSCEAPEAVAAPGHTYALRGRRTKAKQVLSALRKLSRQKYVSSYLAAKIYTALGDNDEAFASLQRAVQERSGWLLFVNVDPCLDPLRFDPRFLGLRESMNLG
jgi:tetratricopeptide (TPR) repeat protein